MSTKPGAYLGGIRNLHHLRERCCIDEDTGCWRWSLSCSSDGTPSVTMHIGGRRVNQRGRRAALILAGRMRGRLLAVPACDTHDCVNPDHAKAIAKSEFHRRIGLSTRGSVAAVKSGQRAIPRLAKITMEQAREIRVSGEKSAVLAERYGICKSTVSAIKCGRIWKDVLANASVFSWASARPV